MREAEARVAVAEVYRRLVGRGLAAAGSSVSVRLDRTRVLVTPAARGEGALEPADFVVTDLTGGTVSGPGRPAAAIELHLLVYAARPDLGAVVHGHLPRATALIPGAAASPPGAAPVSAEVAATLRALIGLSDAVVLDHHGALAVGRTPAEAYDRLEALEQQARVAQAEPQTPVPRPVACGECAGCPPATRRK